MSTRPQASVSVSPDLIEFARGFLGLAAAGPQPEPSSPAEDGAPHLYRQRIYHLIPYGHFDEVLSLCEELNALARARGGTGGSLWIPTVGEQNELIVEFEFDSLAVWEQGRAARNADPQWTGIVRQIGESVIPGSVRTELWETAPHLAT